MKLREAFLKPIIAHLLKLCKYELELNELPPIKLVDAATVGGGASFGEFTDSGIKVVITDRHPMDIARTLVHELVHWKQKTEGMDLDGSDGSDTENQANAIAGVIMRKFGHTYPEYFLDSFCD